MNIWCRNMNYRWLNVNIRSELEVTTACASCACSCSSCCCCYFGEVETKFSSTSFIEKLHESQCNGMLVMVIITVWYETETIGYSTNYQCINRRVRS